MSVPPRLPGPDELSLTPDDVLVLTTKTQDAQSAVEQRHRDGLALVLAEHQAVIAGVGLIEKREAFRMPLPIEVAAIDDEASKNIEPSG